MSFTWVDWLLLSMAVCLVLGAWFGWYLRGMVLERTAYDAEIEMHERILAVRQAGRHAATMPRTQTPDAGHGTGNAATQQVRGNAHTARPASGPKRLVTTAGDIAPVIIPQLGTRMPMRPQPSPEPSHDTVTMRRLPSDTGELRAIGAAWEEKTRREQAVWSHEYHQRCEADRQEAGLTA